MKRMLIFEGLSCAALGIALALTLASLVNVTILRSITADMGTFTGRFSLTPVLLAIAPLLAVTAVVPWRCYRKMAKASDVEKLRSAE